MHCQNFTLEVRVLSLYTIAELVLFHLILFHCYSRVTKRFLFVVNETTIKYNKKKYKCNCVTSIILQSNDNFTSSLVSDTSSRNHISLSIIEISKTIHRVGWLVFCYSSIVNQHRYDEHLMVSCLRRSWTSAMTWIIPYFCLWKVYLLQYRSCWSLKNVQ